MIYALPFYKDRYNYKYNLILENNRYHFLFQYNSRMNRWIMSVSNYKREPIVSGMPVLLGVNLMGRFATSEKPPGMLYLVNLADTNVEAGSDTLSDDYVLAYMNSDDETYLEYA